MVTRIARGRSWGPGDPFENSEPIARVADSELLRGHLRLAMTKRPEMFTKDPCRWEEILRRLEQNLPQADGRVWNIEDFLVAIEEVLRWDAERQADANAKRLIKQVARREKKKRVAERRASSFQTCSSPKSQTQRPKPLTQYAATGPSSTAIGGMLCWFYRNRKKSIQMVLHPQHGSWTTGR